MTFEALQLASGDDQLKFDFACWGVFWSQLSFVIKPRRGDARMPQPFLNFRDASVVLQCVG